MLRLVFFIKNSKSKTHKIGSSFALRFKITQHVRDKQLLLSLKDYFGCGEFRQRNGVLAGDFWVNKLSDILEKVIALLKRYPIYGIKALDFADFCKAGQLIKNQEHLTIKGSVLILKLKKGMNRNR